MDYLISDRMKNMRGSAIREIFKAATDPQTISLAGGNPAPETFPSKELAAIAADLLEKDPVTALQYGVTEGYAPLRELLRDRLKKKEGIGGDGDELIVVSGGQQGIELMTKCLVNEGDTVIVEEPSFIGALNAFRSYGAKLVGVPMERDGMDIDALKKAIEQNKNVKLIYTIPNYQNPTGITMSEAKRCALRETAAQHGIIIIEDNPYGELSFDGVHVRSVKSFDRAENVVYCGSFSKILSPGMRLGYCLAPAALIEKAVIAKQISDVHTPQLTQMMAYEYLRRCDIDANTARSCDLYAHKCRHMISCIDKYFPEEVSHTDPRGGLFIWCDMGGGFDSLKAASECAKDKVVFVPGNTFMTDMSAPCSAFRLNFSCMTDEKTEAGIRILGGCLDRIMHS